MLSIDPFSTKFLSTAKAAEKIAEHFGPLRSGQPVSAVTIWRWINHGLENRNGDTVKLKGILVGRTWATTLDAIREFFTELNSDIDNSGEMSVAGKRDPAKRRSSGRAKKELAAAGWA